MGQNVSKVEFNLSKRGKRSRLLYLPNGIFISKVNQGRYDRYKDLRGTKNYKEQI